MIDNLKEAANSWLQRQQLGIVAIVFLLMFGQIGLAHAQSGKFTLHTGQPKNVLLYLLFHES